MNADDALTVRGLTVRFGDRTILENVSFSVKRGEVFAILGGSGCGKSTLMKHIIGLHRPATGTILIGGQNLLESEGEQRTRILQQMGTLFQSGALYSSFTLAENVALPLEEFLDVPQEVIDLIVEIKLSLVGLDKFESYFPAEISGGMKKRAGLARAMALDPDVLFFDEPSAGLDPITSAELDELILQLRASLGTTMVIVTHELDSIFRIADRVIMLDANTRGIIAEGAPAELRDQSDNPQVRNFFHRRPRPSHGSAPA